MFAAQFLALLFSLEQQREKRHLAGHLPPRFGGFCSPLIPRRIADDQDGSHPLPARLA